MENTSVSTKSTVCIEFNNLLRRLFHNKRTIVSNIFASAFFIACERSLWNQVCILGTSFKMEQKKEFNEFHFAVYVFVIYII